MSFSVVIPARFASTRLPGKPLVDIAGKPMIQRVWDRARASSASRVMIATDDQRIAEVAAAFGAEVCLTDPDHPSGTDRLAEVARLQGFADQDILVNVQGDEPLIPPAVINQVAANLAANPSAAIATLCEPLNAEEELRNPNAVKVVADRQGLALYFSRAPIPWPRDAFAAGEALPAAPAWARHIGIYAYRAGFLQRFVAWPPAEIERLEQLEQLRALYNGERIHVQQACETVPTGVDTEADLAAVRQHVNNFPDA